MPFFFIAPLWILCLLVGTVLFFTRLGSLSLYVLLAPTGFAVCSFLCSTAVLLVAGKWPKLFWHSGLLALSGYLGALLAGGAVGAAGGLALAYRLNCRRRLASSH
jgi:hypothetical protein